MTLKELRSSKSLTQKAAAAYAHIGAVIVSEEDGRIFPGQIRFRARLHLSHP